MSDTRDPGTDQRLPVPGTVDVQDVMLGELDGWTSDEATRHALRRGIESRRALGIRKYGQSVQTHNGRDALLDAWQESLDLATYLYQLRLEGGRVGPLAENAISIVCVLTMMRLERGDAELL